MSKRKLASPEYTLVFIMLFVAVKSSPWGGANRSVYSLVEPKCTGLWTKWPGHRSCFLFSEMIFPWQRAQANCKSKGGTLVSITSKDEQVYIEDHIKFLNRNYFWLGASKKLTKPLLKWEDGSSMSYQNWGAQESSPSSQEREGCLAIEVSTMTWTVLNCSMPVSHICKKSLDAFALKRSNGSEQAITSSPQKVNNAAIQSDDRSCEAGWVAYNDFCYLVKKLTVNWFESYAACWMKQALLAVIETREENFFIQDNIPIGLGLEVWIGLLYNASQKVFENVDDSPVAFTNWRVNEPNNYSTNPESCVYMDSSLGKWYDGDCDLSKNGFVCKKPNGILSENPTTSADTEIDTSPHCSSDSVDISTKCLVIVEEQKTWKDAQADCVSKNGRLLVIDDSQTNRMVANKLIEKTKPYWLGLYSVNSQYKWVDDVAVNFTAWVPSHTGPQNNTCVAVRSKIYSGMWQPFLCQLLMYFLCEVDPLVTTPATVSAAAPATAAVSPKLWTLHGDHYYRMFKTPKTWSGAQLHCETIGGNLISIHDDDTFEFVINQLAKGILSHWIGLTLDSQKTSFLWSDDTAFDFAQWMKGEPDNFNNNMECVQVKVLLKRWSDTNCETKQSFACAIHKDAPILQDPTFIHQE